MRKKISFYLLTSIFSLLPLFETNASEDNSFSQIVNKLIKHENKFVHDHSKSFFDNIENRQDPSITLLTCSDSRVQENIFEDDPTNKIFSVRNIGNQFATSVGSVDYGVKNLKTKVLVIMGHSHCGAVKASMGDYEDEETFGVIRELDHLFLPVRKTQIDYPNVKKDSEEMWSRIVEENVDYQVSLATKKYQEEVKAHKLVIIGLVDDLTNVYKSGKGRSIIVNINNIKEKNKLKLNPVVNTMSKEMKDIFIKRLNVLPVK